MLPLFRQSATAHPLLHQGGAVFQASQVGATAVARQSQYLAAAGVGTASMSVVGERHGQLAYKIGNKSQGQHTCERGNDMKQRLVMSAVLIGLLAGCASTPRTYAPDGRRSYSVNCSGLARDWSICYERAERLCDGRGYDVIAVNGDLGARVSDSPQTLVGATTVGRNLDVACKVEKKEIGFGLEWGNALRG